MRVYVHVRLRLEVWEPDITSKIKFEHEVRLNLVLHCIAQHTPEGG